MAITVYIHTVYDRIFGDFPAKNTIYMVLANPSPNMVHCSPCFKAPVSSQELPMPPMIVSQLLLAATDLNQVKPALLILPQCIVCYHVTSI
jgi:hypothetical protein